MSELHLLRPFTGWRIPAQTVDYAEQLIAAYAKRGHTMYTLTSRRPKRWRELKGGSMYFVQRRRTVFRMPIVSVSMQNGQCWIGCRAQLRRVEPKAVGMVRGWRYLDGAVAPADLPESAPADLMKAAGEAFDRAIIA